MRRIAILFFLVITPLCPAQPPRIISTAHYRIQTDIEAELADDCGRRMDAMYDEYARRFSGVADLSRAPAFDVYLYRGQTDYLKLVGPQFENTGGLFAPSRRFLAAFLEGQGRDSLRRTLQHEAFHQFAHEAMPADLPAWLNEGMAQVFEEGIWTGKEFWIGQAPPRRIRQLQADIKGAKLIDLREVATLSPKQWSEVFVGDRARAATQYNQAWAIVYFLTHYRDEASNQPYRQRLFSMLQLLRDGADGANAFDKVFPDASEVQRRFLTYARTLQPTPEAVLIEKQSVLADLLVELHAHQTMPRDLGAARQALKHGGYRVRYVQGDVHWESDADVSVYFSDAAGHPFAKDGMHFEPRAAAPIPDVVCRCFAHFQLRARFYASGKKIEHEELVEPVK